MSDDYLKLSQSLSFNSQSLFHV